ncbi:MAG: bis-aminopropyl spermidine synthase family protein [Thermoguttaceae bacterium]|nr:bis-aminopropyl spermidine synthase family protein [Thermoguttaceae bacterium]MDW8079635.1 bis-aminopropyl spermidine synthase family protein [Thermoguttaceae bacterium]
MSIPQTTTSHQAGNHSLTRTAFQILRAVASRPCCLWDILSSTDGTIRDIYDTCRWLRERGWIVERDGRVQLGRLPKYWTQALRVDFEQHREQFRGVAGECPAPTTQFFQEPIVPDDVVRRVEFLYERGDLFERAILVLGDDDLFSLAAGLTELPRRIVVGEIDERVVNFINAEAKKRNLKVEAFVYNVAEPLPAHLRRAFDVFVMDPVETVSGFSAWLSRGLAAIRHPGAVYFGLTELECPPSYWHKFQRLLVDCGLVLTDILRNFSHYKNASLANPQAWQKTKLVREAPLPAKADEQPHWYRSSFCRAVTVKTPKVPIRGRIKLDSRFYRSPYTMTLD